MHFKVLCNVVRSENTFLFRYFPRLHIAIFGTFRTKMILQDFPGLEIRRNNSGLFRTARGMGTLLNGNPTKLLRN